MSRRRGPSRKHRKRERREAARHGMTVDQWRNRPPARKRRRTDPYAAHETWRREADQ